VLIPLLRYVPRVEFLFREARPWKSRHKIKKGFLFAAPAPPVIITRSYQCRMRSEKSLFFRKLFIVSVEHSVRFGLFPRQRLIALWISTGVQIIVVVLPIRRTRAVRRFGEPAISSNFAGKIILYLVGVICRESRAMHSWSTTKRSSVGSRNGGGGVLDGEEAVEEQSEWDSASEVARSGLEIGAGIRSSCRTRVTWPLESSCVTAFENILKSLFGHMTQRHLLSRFFIKTRMPPF